MRGILRAVLFWFLTYFPWTKLSFRSLQNPPMSHSSGSSERSHQERPQMDQFRVTDGAGGNGVCPVCRGRTLIEIRGKLQCSRCHTICETCCEGGRG